VAIKRLKRIAEPLLLPEGLEALPLPLLLYRKSDSTVVTNPEFIRTFGAGATARILAARPLGLAQERPVHPSAFETPGRHEGRFIENERGERITVDLRVSAYGKSSDGICLVMFEDNGQRVELQDQLVKQHLELQKSYDQLHSLQQALIQSAKLASLGELASGVAHELNQPLQAIMGFSQELRYIEKLSPVGTEYVEDIVSASKKMAEIIKSLRTFARDSGQELHATSVAHAIEESTRLLRHTLLQAGVELELSIEPELPLTHANPIQLEQVFVNLLSNAKDALESSGVSVPKIAIEARTTDEGILVRVSDNGCGMPSEVRDRIFDPFFTTKPVGKGTGLGLSITHGILSRAGARITVESRPGAGTEFTIVFPIDRSKPEGETA
jgi:C4-dicarboxylate-specific signal transduction histidine kinase